MPFTQNLRCAPKFLVLLAAAASTLSCAGMPGAKRQISSDSTSPPPSAVQGLSVGKAIDGVWGNGQKTELEKVRTGPPGTVDACVTDLAATNTFAERIGYFVNVHMTPEIVEHYVNTGAEPIDVYQLFGIPKAGTLATSLMSHPMCVDSDASFQNQLTHIPMKPVPSDTGDGTYQKDAAGKYVMVPDPETLPLAQKFENLYNSYRDTAKRTQDSTQLQGLWMRMMDCLAYSESLDGPDSKRASMLALKYRPVDEAGNTAKPVGVEFYMDTTAVPGLLQLTIGLFQFTPGAIANQYPCTTAWNRQYPSCPIDPTHERAHTWALASPYQTYNAFCGTDKLVESFFTQVNTTDPTRTNLSNVNADGSIKAPADRCVTPFFKAGLSFNHFGPLQNSFQNQQLSNMKKALACAVGGL